MCKLCENGIIKQAPDRIGKLWFRFSVDYSNTKVVLKFRVSDIEVEESNFFEKDRNRF